MKHLFSIIFLLIVSVLFCSCKKSISYDKIQIRDNVVFEVNEAKPYTGEVVHGSLDGVKKEYVENYLNGKLEGKTIWYHDNGKKKWVINYVNGKQEGERIDYFEDGATERNCNYKNDCLVSETVYYTNGQKKFEGNFVNKKVLTTAERFEFYKANNEFVDEKELNGNVKFYEANGDIGYELTVDNNKLYNRFYKKNYPKGDAYYINKHIIPFDDIIQASIKSVAERRSLLGKPIILEKLPGVELYELVLIGSEWSECSNRQAIITFSSSEGSDNVRLFRIEIEKEASSVKKLIENTAKYFDTQGYKYVKRNPITYSKKFGDWNAEVIFGESDGVGVYAVIVDKSKK
jgi:antitoxin component YwqK of YwqJK toxin-antitoxin module